MTKTCFLLLDPKKPSHLFINDNEVKGSDLPEEAGVTTTVVDFPEQIGVALEACSTLTTRVVPIACGVLVPLLKIAAVALLFISVIVEKLPIAVVLMGVMVTPEVVLAGCSRFCKGSGISPLKLARISATFRRSV